VAEKPTNQPQDAIIESITGESTPLSQISDGDLLLGIGQGNEEMYFEYIARKLKKNLDSK